MNLTKKWSQYLFCSAQKWYIKDHTSFWSFQLVVFLQQTVVNAESFESHPCFLRWHIYGRNTWLYAAFCFEPYVVCTNLDTGEGAPAAPGDQTVTNVLRLCKGKQYLI